MLSIALQAAPPPRDRAEDRRSIRDSSWPVLATEWIEPPDWPNSGAGAGGARRFWRWAVFAAFVAVAIVAAQLAGCGN